MTLYTTAQLHPCCQKEVELTWEQKECPHGMLTGPANGSLHIEHSTLRSRRES
jgi:hypothetical protein